jgi:small subunit ribosomal protein S8
MFTHLRSGQEAQKLVILHPKSKLCSKILNILWEEGYILGYRISPFNPTVFEIFLKYYKQKPTINKIAALSKPSLRLYIPLEHLWKLNNGLGVIILSTPKGIISDTISRKLNVGGEAFCIIK